MAGWNLSTTGKDYLLFSALKDVLTMLGFALIIRSENALHTFLAIFQVRFHGGLCLIGVAALEGIDDRRVVTEGLYLLIFFR